MLQVPLAAQQGHNSASQTIGLSAISITLAITVGMYSCLFEHPALLLVRSLPGICSWQARRNAAWLTIETGSAPLGRLPLFTEAPASEVTVFLQQVQHWVVTLAPALHGCFSGLPSCHFACPQTPCACRLGPLSGCSAVADWVPSAAAWCGLVCEATVCSSWTLPPLQDIQALQNLPCAIAPTCVMQLARWQSVATNGVQE